MLADKKDIVLEKCGLDFHAEARDTALDERAQRADRTEEPAHDVVDAGAGTQRIAGAPGHVREAAHHLHDLVECRTVFVGAGQEAL